jgi:hypothetical protein
MAKPATAARGLFSYQLTLTDADTNYNLQELIAAVEPSAPTFCRELLIQADDGNSTNKVMIGDLNTSSTRFGFKLAAGDSRTYVYREAMVDVRDFYVRCDGASKKINVELLVH